MPAHDLIMAAAGATPAGPAGAWYETYEQIYGRNSGNPQRFEMYGFPEITSMSTLIPGETQKLRFSLGLSGNGIYDANDWFMMLRMIGDPIGYEDELWRYDPPGSPYPSSLYTEVQSEVGYVYPNYNYTYDVWPLYFEIDFNRSPTAPTITTKVSLGNYSTGPGSTLLSEFTKTGLTIHMPYNGIRLRFVPPQSYWLYDNTYILSPWNYSGPGNGVTMEYFA